MVFSAALLARYASSPPLSLFATLPSPDVITATVQHVGSMEVAVRVAEPPAR